MLHHHDVEGTELGRVLAKGSPGVLPLEERFRLPPPAGAAFRNPILPAPSADPWLVFHEGFYYYCESRHQDTIWIRKARSFTELNQTEGKMVWSAPGFGPNSRSVWAPELHLLDGRWYIYYAADDGRNENHRMWVLEGLTSDPTGPYRCRGALQTSGWAIDGTILQIEKDSYFLWSGWPGKENGLQNLYLAPMTNPWTLGAERVLFATPEYGWETVDMAVCEGPQVLKNGGRIFVVYSASGSWTVDYCLGLVELTGTDPLTPANWRKHGCVFRKTDYVWGIGHCSFVKSPDGSEDWIIYHAKSKRKKGWNDRNVRAQKFLWREDGLPDFGAPVPAGVSISLPSGHKSAEIGI